jgi:hypothetical protein|tara:strand:- start:53 stop:808 length:756 start_codon:yes stop_codon:yes gene_type:complete
MNKVAFNGCSFTRGDGFPIAERDTVLYYGQVAKHLGCEFDNNAKGGYSNLRIFHSAYEDIVSEKYNTVFVQWSYVNRTWLSPRPNQWYFMGSRFAPINNIYGESITFTKAEIDKITDTYMLLNGDYQNLIELVTYSNILEQLAKVYNTKIVFINGIVLWTEDMFQPFDSVAGLSDYAKEVYDIETNTQAPVEQFHNNLYSKTSTLNKNLWINLCDSMFKITFDFAPEDGVHPGPKTHQLLAEKIILFLEKG